MFTNFLYRGLPTSLSADAFGVRPVLRHPRLRVTAGVRVASPANCDLAHVSSDSRMSRSRAG